MPLRLTLRQLEYLQAVADCGSIAAAADEVGVSSPSISVAIAQLEADFGLQLFVRKHAHGLTLTPAGSQVLVQVRHILAEASRLVTLASTIAGRVAGPLRIGCLSSFAAILLPRLRKQFVKQQPEVEFRQFELSQTQLIEGLRNATLDVAVTYDLGIPTDLRFKSMMTLPPYAIVAASHVLAGVRSISPRELAAHGMVLLDLPLSAEYFLSFFEKAGCKPLIAERTRDMAVMQSMVANGFGYGLANFAPASDQAPDGKRLRYIPLTGAVRVLRLGLLTTQHDKPTLTVKTFAEFCTQYVTNEFASRLHQ